MENQPETSHLRPAGNYRWVICALLFFATTINYLDRQVMGLLKDSLSLEFQWTEKDYSRIVMAFSATYAIGLLFFGRVIDRIGTRTGYTVSVVVWSLAAMGHALAQTTIGFGVARGFLGLGEAGNFPAAIKATAEWFPKKERSLATGIFNSGTNVAAIVGPVAIAWIYTSFGWKEAFIWTGLLGIVWLILWQIFYEIPSRQRRLTLEEFDYIHAGDDAADCEGSAMPWSTLMKRRQTWAFILGKFLTDPIWWFYLFWVPSYFYSSFGMNLSKSALHISTIYVAAGVGSVLGGYLPTWLVRQKKWEIFRARKTAMLIYALLVIPVVALRFVTDIWTAVALISLATAAHQGWSANIFTTVSDMFPKRAVSSVVGIGGMAGSVGGIIFPMLVGILLDHYKILGNITIGYNFLFVICGSTYVLAWILMHWLAPTLEKIKE